MITIEPGIYPGVPYDQYEQWDAINNSMLWTLNEQSPLHAKVYRDNPPKPTEALITGQAAHTLALEPDKFLLRYAVAPKCKRTTKAGKAIYETFLSSVNGKMILTPTQFEQAQAVADSVLNHEIRRFIQKGEAEVCIVWMDKKTGLLCKARLDYVHRLVGENAIIIDLKSIMDASPKAFQRAMLNYGYHQQAAFYSDGWKVLTNDAAAFVFLPVEKEVPHAVAAYEVGDNTILAGRLSYRKALITYAECLKTNYWPAYSDTVELLDLPEWYLKNQGVNQYQIQTEE